MLLFDAQTSGGLLLGIPSDKIDGFEKRAQEMNQPIWRIGKVGAGSGVEIEA